MKREALKKIAERLRMGFARFAPFNLVAIAVAVLVVLNIHEVLSEATSFNLARGLYWGALMGVVCQLDGERRASRWHKIAAWPVTLLFGALGCWFWFGAVDDSSLYEPWMMVYSGTLIAFAAIDVALLYRIADEKTLFSRLVANAIFVCGSALIFIGSIALCVLAFDKLVMGVPGRLYADVSSALYLILVPVGFASLLPHDKAGDDTSDKSAAFLFWLLLPASIILLAILYLYLGRIVLTRTMPSGKLNWFGSIALATYVFFWLALRDSTRPFFRRFVRWGWALLIPVLAAQIVGIVIRYNAYGLSTLRFAGMITLLIGTFALVLAAFDRRPRILFVFIAIAGFIFTVTPLNIIDVPIRNQEARLKAALARNGIVPDGELKAKQPIPYKDATIIFGAWNYLTDATTVYYRPTAFRCITKKLGTDSLFKRLGIDESAMPHSATYRGRQSSGAYSSVTIRLAGDGKIPMGNNYTHIHYEGWIDIGCRNQRYFLRLPTGPNGDSEEFDVTPHILRIYTAAQWNGLIPQNSISYVVPIEHAIWKLRPGLAFAIGESSIHFRGPVGQTIDSLSIEKGIILSKGIRPNAMVCRAGERQALFNGRDLAGWTAVVDYDVTGGYHALEPTWFATNGVIRTTGTPFGYLRTKRDDFANFKLHVEYRWWRMTNKPNSGVFVRLSSERGSFIPTAIENQLCRGSAGDILGLGGFSFAGLKPRNAYEAAKPLSGITKVLRKGADVEKPFGEWNIMEIDVNGDTIANYINGVEVNRVSGATEPTGAIALQSEGGAAEFRNLWIEER